MYKCTIVALLLWHASNALDAFPDEDCGLDVDSPVPLSLLQVVLGLRNNSDGFVAGTAAAASKGFIKDTHIQERALAFQHAGASSPLHEKTADDSVAGLLASPKVAAHMPAYTVPCIPFRISSYVSAMWMMLVTMALVLAGYMLLGLPIQKGWLHSTSAAGTSTDKGDQSEPSQEAAKTSPAPKILVIDGLRVIFTVYIILFHWISRHLGFWNAEGFTAPNTMHFFFVTSGFVGMLTVQAKLQHFDCVSGLAFFLKRMGRLCPLYYLALLMTALVSSSDESYEQFPIQAAFGQVLWPVACPGDFATDVSALTGNSPGWFVSDLIFLSACFPLLYNLCPRDIDSCLFALFTVLIVQFLFVGVFLHHYFGSVPSLTYFWVGCRVPEFVAGMLSARICHRLPPWAHAWNGWGWVFDGAVIGMAICGIVTVMSPKITILYVMMDTLLPAILSILVISAHAVPRTVSGLPVSGVLGKCLSCTPLQALSRYSFAVYILQAPIIKELDQHDPFPSSGENNLFAWWSSWDTWILPVIVCHVAGVFVYHLIEEPAQYLADAYLRQ